ncbi:MAG: hypothetical protein KAG80_09850 [Nocardioides sp.]|nr:hypothetical protein [Nocardioides sp.]
MGDDQEDEQVVGPVRNLVERRNTSGRLWAEFGLDSADGSISAVCFPRTYSQLEDTISEGTILAVTGRFADLGVRVLVVHDAEVQGEGTRP